MQVKSKTDWLRADVKAKTGTIDREKGIVHGVILAEEGPFKDRRGEFDRAAIRKVVSLAKLRPGGLKARFMHPSLSADGLGKFLGRYHDVRSDTVLREAGHDANGKPLVKEMQVARGDLYLDKTALEEPPGGGKPLGLYVMDLAESDPDAFGASLVLLKDERPQLDTRGRQLTDDKGQELPPLWMPTALHACDVVDDGDATHSFLSSDLLASLPDAIVRQGCELLDAQFAGKDREFVRAHLNAFVERYLSHAYPEEEDTDPEEPTSVDEPTDVEDKAESDEAVRLAMYVMENE